MSNEGFEKKTTRIVSFPVYQTIKGVRYIYVDYNKFTPVESTGRVQKLKIADEMADVSLD